MSSQPPFTIRELDGSPKLTQPTEIIVPNGSLAVAGRRATLIFSGGGGGGGDLLAANNLSELTNFATARSNLGLAIGSQIQAFDAELAAIAGLTSAADRLPYFTGSATASLATFTSFGRSLVDDADAATGRSTLGLVIGTNVQAWDADLDAIAALGGTGFAKRTGSNTWSLDTSTYATQAYADALVVGLLDDRGNFDASGNAFPSSGGSGSAGAILKGDLWTISVAGTLGGTSVTAGDVVRALTDTPGQTTGNWAIGENNFGYVALNQAIASGKFYVGNGSGIGTAVTPTGDVTFDNTGAFSIGAGKVTNAMLAGSIDLTTKVTGILPGANGGTGNGFTAFSGPATSLKTFTLPNANASLAILAANTFIATQTITPAVNTGGLVVSGYSLTGSDTHSLIDLSGTWNTSGTPTLIKANITNTASGTLALFVDFQIGGVSQLSVGKSGNLVSASSVQGSSVASSASGGVLTLGADGTEGKLTVTGAADKITLYVGATEVFGVNTTDFHIGQVPGDGFIDYNDSNSLMRIGVGGRKIILGDANAQGNNTQLRVDDSVGIVSINSILVLSSDPSFVVDGSAVLQVDSTVSGFLPPRGTEADRDAIGSPAEGLEFFNLDSHEPNYFNGSTWESFGGVGGSPGGSPTQIQYNNSGSFDAVPGFTYDSSQLRLGTATTADSAADFLIGISGTTKKGLVIQAKATPTASPFVVQQSDGTPFFQVQSDGGVIIDQQTQATYSRILDVKFQGAHLLEITPSGATLTGSLSFGSFSNVISFGGDLLLGRLTTGAGNLYGTDAVTNAVTNTLTLDHLSSGTAAAGFGTGLLFRGHSSTGSIRNMAQVASVWTTATDASRTADLVFYGVNNAASPAEVIRFAGGGNVTVANLAGTGARAVLADSAGVLSAPVSDARLKRNVRAMSDEMDVWASLDRLRGVYFNWDTEQRPQLGAQREIGFIAQEVEKVLPELTGHNKDGMMYVRYPEMTAFLMEAVKGLHARVAHLESR